MTFAKAVAVAALCAGMAACPLSGALAQGAPPAGDLTVFDAAYFAASQPQTALDMISRLPGFTFDEGDEDVRGYAGAAGNVLIDGQRPASKYDSLEAVLKRIPAASIERIDLIRGAAPGIDMQGQTVVANVVRRKVASLEAQVEAGLFAHLDGRLLPEAALEVSRRKNDQLLEAAIRLTGEADDESGQGFEIVRDPAGGLIESARTRLMAEERGVQANVAWEQPLAGGRLRLNGAVLGMRGDADELTRSLFPGSGEDSLVTETERLLQGEFGAHFSRSLGPRTELEALVIQQVRGVESVEREAEGPDEAAFTEDATSGETIARASLRFARSSAWSFDMGGEAAFNFLDSSITNTENGIPVPLPAANVRVEERRAEGFARATRRFGSRLSLEAGGAVEVSKISQSGDIELERSFVYPKPRGLMTWNPTATDQVRLRIEREVGQLDFGDFVSSAEFSTGTVNAGNAELKPYTAWVLEAAWERRFANDATLVLTARHFEISDVVDLVPVLADTDGDGIDEVFEGPGNIGSGRQDEVQASLSLPLERLRIKGGLLKADLTWRRTSVTDPVTGEKRRIIGDKQPLEGAIEFSQDLPARRLKWGVEVKLGDKEYEYRLDEVRVEGDHTSVGVFAEMFPAAGWSVRLEAQNLTAREVYLIRDRYDGPRDTGALEGVQSRSRAFQPYVYLRVRRQIR